MLPPVFTITAEMLRLIAELELSLKELVQHGHLLPKGQGRGAHYVRPSS